MILGRPHARLTPRGYFLRSDQTEAAVGRTTRLLLTVLLLVTGLLATVTPAAEAQRRGGRRSSYSRSYSPRSSRGSSYRAPRARAYRAPVYRAPRVRTYHARLSSGVRARTTRTRSYTPRPSRAPSYSAGSPSRDSRGRIRRSRSARQAFERQTGYPRGRPGYIIDHIVPLACGGADAPSNMQWQTRAAAKAKDRTERVGCSSGRRR
jgi:5-methylcytosine-specific restriction endonuclease McrA